jgi:small subunit ribosomal protein S11
MKTQNNILAHLYIQCALKNTILSLTNFEGKLYKQWSAKSLKKTDLKKNTPYNIQLITRRIKKYIFSKKIRFLKIYIKGNGSGRYNVIQHIDSKKFKVIFIFDNTKLPFNGCRAPKQKRR